MPAEFRETCKPFRAHKANDPFAAGARVAVSCDILGNGIAEYALFKFADTSDLEVYFTERMKGVNVPLSDAWMDRCTWESRGSYQWDQGRIACWVSQRDDPNTAHVRWTDEKNRIYGIIDATNEDIPNAYDWWWSNYYLYQL